MNLSEFTLRLDSLSPGMIDDAQLTATLPAILDYAEQRIYRELDLLAAEVTDASGVLTAGTRTFNYVATTPFVILMKVNLFSGAAGAAVRSQAEPVSRDLLDAVYGSPNDLALPRWFAVTDPQTLMLGPWPDQAYGIELVGKVRPPSLYAAGPFGSSFLSTYLPDLLLAAALAHVEAAPTSGAKPAEPVWEGQYQKLLASAAVEEARRQFQGPGWSSLSTPAGASPTR